LLVAATGVLSASRRIFTICSSLNRLVFIAPPGFRRGMLSGFSRSEKREAGQDVERELFTD
jgi:hypothetical protein